MGRSWRWIEKEVPRLRHSPLSKNIWRSNKVSTSAHINYFKTLLLNILCVFVCAHMHIYVHGVTARRQPVIPQIPSSSFSSSSHLSFPPFLLSVFLFYVTWVVSIEPRSSRLQNKHITKGSHLSSPNVKCIDETHRINICGFRNSSLFKT